MALARRKKPTNQGTKTLVPFAPSTSPGELGWSGVFILQSKTRRVVEGRGRALSGYPLASVGR
jgi:hypothetical protein